jgi:hypothetical protein
MPLHFILPPILAQPCIANARELDELHCQTIANWQAGRTPLPNHCQLAMNWQWIWQWIRGTAAIEHNNQTAVIEHNNQTTAIEPT